jgi:hypothetical protein
MPGLAPISLQQFISPTTGRPYAGARAAFYEAASNVPITVYQDYGLGTPHSNPVIADAYGRFPPIFIDEDVGFYRLRITTSAGVVLPLGEDGHFDIDVLPVIGPTAGDGGGGSETPVDQNSVLQTGDVIWTPAKTTRAGFVRLNGRTVGSASSGASERANSDCEDIYAFLYNNFSNSICPVTGGRGSNAAADWAANKPIATIDMRGRAPFGLADMGSSTSNRLSGITFALGDATTGGSSGGASTVTIAQTNLPNVNLTAQSSGSAHFHFLRNVAIESNFARGTGPSGPDLLRSLSPDDEVRTESDGAHPHTVPLGGSGTALNKMPPFVLGTWLMRL